MMISSQLVDKGGGASTSTIQTKPSFAQTLQNGGVTNLNVNKQTINELNKIDVRHAIEISSIDGVPVYDFSKAVADVVGPRAVKYAGRQSGKVILYLSDSSFVDQISTTGITVGSIYRDVTPVVTPIRKVLISNINPEVPDRVIMPFLERHGNVVKPPTRLSAGYPAPQRHVLSFRRQCGIIMTDNEQQIDEDHRFEYGGRSHRIFISTDGLVCFQCRSRGHIARNCPQRAETGSVEHQDNTPKRHENNTQTNHVDEDGFTLVQPKKGYNIKNKKTNKTDQKQKTQDENQPKDDDPITTVPTAEPHSELNSDVHDTNTDEMNNSTGNTASLKTPPKKHQKARHDIDHNQLIDLINLNDTIVPTVTKKVITDSKVPTTRDTDYMDSEVTGSFDLVVPELIKRKSNRRARSISPVFERKSRRTNSLSELSSDILDPGESDMETVPLFLSGNRSGSIASMFSLPGGDESEAELDNETTPNENFILPQTHRQNILDFVNSLFNKKKPMRIIKNMYPDLRVFLKAVASLKQEEGLDQSLKNRLNKLIKNVQKRI